MRVSGFKLIVGVTMCSLFSWAQVLDALIVEPGDSPVTMYRNNGSAFFEEILVEIDLNVSLDARSIALEDFDGDGDLDVMIGYRTGNAVWFNDGFGNFTDSEQVLGESNTVILKAGDLDGDGDIDVFAGNWSAANIIWLNDGQGTFTESVQVFSYTAPEEGEELVPDEEDTRAVDFGDLDSDGDLDIFYMDLNSTGLTQVWFNDGLGNFTIAETPISLGSFDVFDIALGDLDADGDLDVFLTMINDSANLIFFNDGTGTFVSSGQQLGSSRSAKVTLGDLDLDGDLDAFVANSDFHCDGANHVWFNDGEGTFTGGLFFGNSPSLSADLGDLDGDGDLDAIIANRGSVGWANRIWINDGLGGFSDGGQRLGAGRTAGIVLGNLRSSETKAAKRILAVPNYSDLEGKLTLVLDNPALGPQSMRVDAYSEEGERIKFVNLVFKPRETQRVKLSFFDGASTLIFSENSRVKAYIQTDALQTINESRDFKRTWSFSDTPQFKTTYFISNPQAVEAELMVSVGSLIRQTAIIIPALGSRTLTFPNHSKPSVKGNNTIVLKSDIPVAILSTQRLPENPDLLLPQQALP